MFDMVNTSPELGDLLCQSSSYDGIALQGFDHAVKGGNTIDTALAKVEDESLKLLLIVETQLGRKETSKLDTSCDEEILEEKEISYLHRSIFKAVIVGKREVGKRRNPSRDRRLDSEIFTLDETQQASGFGILQQGIILMKLADE
jgi:hypothetical protein